MFFKLEYTIRQLHLNWDLGRSIYMSFGGPHQISVEFRLPTEDEQKIGHKRDNAFGTAISIVEPPAYITEMFSSLANNRLPPGGKSIDAKQEYVEPNGEIKGNLVVPLYLLPDDFQQFANGIQSELADFLKRALNILRWRYNAAGPHSPFSFLNFRWSYDSEKWYHMPSTLSSSFEIIKSLDAREINTDEIVKLVMEKANEPIGHELFREAWQQRHMNRRSSLVIGIAAAEAGFKDCVAILVPDAGWLVENVPSPPLGKMLRKYLPMLPTKLKIQGLVKSPPNRILKAIEEGVELRNKVVHVGGGHLTYDQIDEILLAIQDLLWILDYYMGFSWAANFISPETRKDLGL